MINLNIDIVVADDNKGTMGVRWQKIGVGGMEYVMLLCPITNKQKTGSKDHDASRRNVFISTFIRNLNDRVFQNKNAYVVVHSKIKIELRSISIDVVMTFINASMATTY